MKNVIVFFILLFMLQQPVYGEDKNMDFIMLTIPESILVKAVKKTVPLQLNTGSESVEGSITIQKINNLQLGEQHISGMVTVIGKDIQIKTAIAGQELRLKVGTITLDFNLFAQTRYDEPSQTLYIKPTVSNLNQQDGQKAGELGALLVGLFNGKEFPLSIDKLQPIITDTGSKKLIIETRITDIRVSKNVLTLYLLPDIREATR